jgi:sugar-specific transcriptional regulator TrmB
VIELTETINRIDQDTIEVTTTTKKTVKISELEAELTEHQAINADAEAIETWKETLEEDKKGLVVSMPTIDTSELEQKIAEYKALKVEKDVLHV